MKPDEVIDLRGDEEKGGESVVPIVNENVSTEETQVSPSKEKKEGT
jgi:hypothetical protein